jgi:hypothetical protein
MGAHEAWNVLHPGAIWRKPGGSFVVGSEAARLCI